jgi:hypothetical protein
MIDLLLINPGAQAGPIINALSATNGSYQIVTTAGQMFAYPLALQVLNLNTSPWDRSQRYKSAIAWDNSGQRLLDRINGQIILHNKPLSDRTVHYLTSKFEFELGRVFNILSHKGQHVIIDASFYKNAKWNLIKDQKLPFFTSGVECAFTFLDSIGIINGPSQVFIEPDGKLSISMIPRDNNTAKISTRQFLDIWPTILSLEDYNVSSASSSLTFFDWIVRTGPANQFQFEIGL